MIWFKNAQVVAVRERPRKINAARICAVVHVAGRCYAIFAAYECGESVPGLFIMGMVHKRWICKEHSRQPPSIPRSPPPVEGPAWAGWPGCSGVVALLALTCWRSALARSLLLKAGNTPWPVCQIVLLGASLHSMDRGIGLGSGQSHGLEGKGSLCVGARK